MDISEVVSRSGFPASTLRYYEEKGLIASTGRSGLKRLFAPSVLDQLALIALGRAAGFSLDDMGAMFDERGEPNIDRQDLLNRADTLDDTIRKLSAMRDGLRHAAKCQAPSHLECPQFRRLMAVASARVKGEKSRGAGRQRVSSS
ncbi:helix-turn-helix domain-containing protein [Alcanivorax sp.]|jgi:DNA-binding transcriptional MerR regulator|uniref:helix-turn-helix domain-containing protein n=1 Tax=Alcanivorax sp. TaxID=1872427 RepID=UPI0032D91978